MAECTMGVESLRSRISPGTFSRNTCADRGCIGHVKLKFCAISLCHVSVEFCASRISCFFEKLKVGGRCTSTMSFIFLNEVCYLNKHNQHLMTRSYLHLDLDIYVETCLFVSRQLSLWNWILAPSLTTSCEEPGTWEAPATNSKAPCITWKAPGITWEGLATISKTRCITWRLRAWRSLRSSKHTNRL